MPTAVTVSDGTKTTRHEIDFTGFTGIIFWLFLAVVVLFIIAFSTQGWMDYTVGGTGWKVGLWQSCICSKTSGGGIETQSWFKASQAFFTMGLVALIACMVLISLYMIVHSLNKNTIMMLMIGGIWISVLFLFIGLMIFGIAGYSHGFSYAFACISTIGCAVVGVLVILQKRKAENAAPPTMTTTRPPATTPTESFPQ